jgi:hypothetical protein
VTAAFADDDLFHVLVSDDDMKRMNVDQLADAFRLSVIDASTLVWQTGMNGWRRLGSIADVEPELEAEEELETAVLWAAPLPPPPVPAPRRRTTAAYQTTAPYRATVPQAPVYQAPAQAPAPHHSPASYFERPAYQQAAPAYQPAPTYPEPEPYYAQASYQTVPDPFAQPELMSPVYSPALPEPDPYVLPKRRVDIPEKIDFRRAPGSIRWGRWFVALLVMTGGVVGAYRQNLLRDGARGIGIESTYLAAEQRTTAFVSAKSSPGVKRVLERLALLPGPNAQTGAAPEPAPPTSKHAAPILLGAAPAVAAPPCVAQPIAPQKAEIKQTSDAEVKTVSLNALPLLGRASSAKPAAAERAEPSEPAITRARKSAPAKADADEEEDTALARPSKKKARAERREASEEPEEKPVAKAKKEKREPSKPKAAALPPPPTDGNPLKAAMWSTVASDTKKLAARKQRD